MEDKKLLEWREKNKAENHYLSDTESDMLGKSYRPLNPKWQEIKVLLKESPVYTPTKRFDWTIHLQASQQMRNELNKMKFKKL